MSQEGGRESFCPLLWRANGGWIGPTGKPVVFEGQEVRGLCTRPYDCNECYYLENEISQHPPGTATWACPECLKAAIKKARENQTPIAVPGFFSEGYCEFPSCTRQGNSVTGDPARYSRFRQIIFGQIR